MLKCILFDVDRILIKSSGELFSVRYSHDFDIPLETITSFINNEAKLCKLGKADLKEELSKYINSWKWNKSVDDLLNYWYANKQVVNQEILNVIYELKQKGIKCFIASDNEKYRAQQILESLNSKKYFSGAFFSYDLGFTKADQTFFTQILKLLNDYKPHELLLCDDKQRNLDIAHKVGLQSYLYTNNEDFKEYLKKYL